MRYPRRQLFVDRQVQGALVRRVLLHWMSFAGGLALLVAVMQYFQNPLISLDDHIDLFVRRNSLVFLILLSLIPIFAWDTVRLSHRFAGPVLRLHRMMKELAIGNDPGELRFRDGDFWNELAEQLNGIRAALLHARQSHGQPAGEQEFATTAQDAN